MSAWADSESRLVVIASKIILLDAKRIFVIMTYSI
jgi:hypothetical protein